jgi:hypothetical protein
MDHYPGPNGGDFLRNCRVVATLAKRRAVTVTPPLTHPRRDPQATRD